MSRLLTLLFLSAIATAHAADPTPPATKIPELKIATVDGSSFELAKQRGKWVVVNFWATWCAPCRKEMPDLSKFGTERKADVRVVGLAFEETELADIKAFLKANPVSYPIALVDVYDPPKDFEAPRGLPTTYLIAPDGHVAERFLGPITSQMLAQSIEKNKR